jgi:hypothetical protein
MRAELSPAVLDIGQRCCPTSRRCHTFEDEQGESLLSPIGIEQGESLLSPIGIEQRESLHSPFGKEDVCVPLRVAQAEPLTLRVKGGSCGSVSL